jgi:hypothetical protein
MTRVVVFKGVSGINCDVGVKPSPVRALEPHLAFYSGVLGLTLVGRDQQSAVRLGRVIGHEHPQHGALPYSS